MADGSEADAVIGYTGDHEFSLGSWYINKGVTDDSVYEGVGRVF